MPGRTYPAVLLALAAAVAISTPPAAAQEPGDVVPRDLVLALLTGQGGPVSIHVGAAPPGLPPGLPPGDAPAIGGVTRPWGTTVILPVMDDPRSALEAYQARLTEAGFAQPPGLPSRGGFQMDFPGQINVWCGEGVEVQPLSFGVEGRTYLRLIVREVRPQRSPCSRPSLLERETRDLMRDPFASLPTLLAPEGARIDGPSGGGSSSRSYSSATIHSAMEPEVLADAFGDQLAAAGWTRTESVATASLALSLWRVPATDDFPEREATLTVWRRGTERHYGELAILTPDEP